MTDDAPTAEASGPPELPKCPLCRAHGQAMQRAGASRAGCSNKECGLRVQAKTLDEAVAAWAAICDSITPVRLLQEIDKYHQGESKNLTTDSDVALAVGAYVESIGAKDAAPETDD